MAQKFHVFRSVFAYCTSFCSFLRQSKWRFQKMMAISSKKPKFQSFCIFLFLCKLSNCKSDIQVYNFGKNCLFLNPLLPRSCAPIKLDQRSATQHIFLSWHRAAEEVGTLANSTLRHSNSAVLLVPGRKTGTH